MGAGTGLDELGSSLLFFHFDFSVNHGLSLHFMHFSNITIYRWV
jgi:hypothetical protein